MRIGHHRLRIGRVSLPGQVYLITFCTHERKPWFAQAAIAQDAVAALLDSSYWTQAELLTWVLMPDHWHGLIALSDDMTLATAIGRLKGGSAHTIGRRHRQIRPLWQRAYHDRALRHEEAVRDVARYIIQNPVRAGLVDRPADYPYWGSRWCEEFIG